LSSYLGEIAALTTAVCWSLTSTFFTIGGRYVGSVVVNRTRLVIALGYLSLAHYALHGELLPIHAETSRWGWLGLSGLVGLVLGDSCLFQAFVLVGPHLSMLLMSLVPIISTAIAWFLLGEVISPVKLWAVVLTVSGVILVVFKKKHSHSSQEDKDYFMGILFGIGGALGQASGLIIAKKGLAGDFPGLSATLIRVCVAAAAIWIFAFAKGQARQTLDRLTHRRASISIALGAFAGPFLGIWLSMVAIKLTYVGIASTLMALPPVMLLPISYVVFKEEITIRSVIGTALALLGVALIFLT